MRWRAVVGFVISVVLVFAAGVAGASEVFHSKEYAQGAGTDWSDCPWEIPPADGQVCRTYHLLFFARLDHAVNGGPIDRPGGETFVELLILTERFDADSDSFELLALEIGRSDVTGSFDAQHLSSAHMDAPGPLQLFDIDLDTFERTPSGRTAVLGAMTWTASGDRIVFGNDSPVLGGSPRHVGNRCETANFNFHQKFRPATLAGPIPTIDGIPIDAPFQPDPAAAVVDGWFHIVIVGKNCP